MWINKDPTSTTSSRLQHETDSTHPITPQSKTLCCTALAARTHVPAVVPGVYEDIWSKVGVLPDLSMQPNVEGMPRDCKITHNITEVFVCVCVMKDLTSCLELSRLWLCCEAVTVSVVASAQCSAEASRQI